MSAQRAAWPTEPQELLLKAALWEGEAAFGAWREWRAGNSVAATDAESRWLFPLLSRNLSALAADDPQIASLKNTYRHQWLENQLRMRAAGQALGALTAAGVETMVLKGAALAPRYYQDLGARPMGDVDILVRPERVRAGARALVDAGWRQCPTTDLGLLLVATHGTAFTNSTGARIDLHWYAMWSPAVEDDFWSAAEPVDVGGAPTLGQCPADQLLQVCVHGWWAGGHRVRWVPDAFTVIRTSPDLDWNRVLERSRTREVVLPLSQTLHYLHRRLGAEIPAFVLESLRRHHFGPLERATNRAFQAPPSTLSETWLVLERYRRQRVLPPGPARERNLVRYLRAYASMRFGLKDNAPVTPALIRAVLSKVR